MASSMNDDLERQLLALFVVEAGEHLQAINRSLLALESRPELPLDAKTLAEPMREAHSLKGAARAVNLDRIESLAHALESLFQRLQTGKMQLSLPVFDLAYRVLDGMGGLVLAAGGQAPAPGGLDDAGLLAQLEALRPALHEVRPQAPAPTLEQTSGLEPGGETVRVTTQRLDALLARIGEVQVARLGAEQRLPDVHLLQESLAGWESEWRKTRPRFRRLLHGLDAAAGNAARDERPVFEYVQASEARLRALREGLDALQHALQADQHRMSQAAAELDEEISQARLQPVSAIFTPFARMVRDLARSRDKQVSLLLQGSETGADRAVLEQLRDPLLHLLRNAIDHGIEPPEARRKSGKPLQAVITLKAARQGSNLLIEVSDDGAGIDVAGVVAAAVSKNLLSRQAAEALSEREALWLIFNSGLSTSPVVTDLSGRGVGLDVVRQHVEDMHGLIDVASQPGQGTRFTLTVPLSLATTLCLQFQAGTRRLADGTGPHEFALPVTNVMRLLRVTPGQTGSVEGRPVMRVDGEPVALLNLTDVLRLPPAPRPVGARGDEPRPGILVGLAEKRAVFLVDAILGARQMVIKRLPPPLLRVRYTSGAAILGTGAVLLLLEPSDLLRSAEGSRAAPEPTAQPQGQPVQAPMILVTDDSITTRTLEKNILEMAGYRVHLAADGLDAWTYLQDGECDLLVSDVSMPRMTGFELAARLRADPRFASLPIILVTSLDSPEEREQGIQSGADAYITKGAFDQEQLLDTVRRSI